MTLVRLTELILLNTLRHTGSKVQGELVKLGTWHDLAYKMSHRGIFNGWKVLGHQFEYPDGKIAWQIMAHAFHKSGRFCWVVGNEFFEVCSHTSYDAAGNSLIHTFGKATEVEEEERNSILKAISTWEDSEGSASTRSSDAK